MRGVLLVLVLALGAAFWWWFGSRGGASDGAPTAVARAPASLMATCIGEARLILVEQGDRPVSDVLVRIGPSPPLRSDASGQVFAPDLPCGVQDVEILTEDWRLVDDAELALLVQRTLVSVRVQIERVCDGLVRVVDEAGAPVEGSVVNAARSLQSEELIGGETWMERRCGANLFEITETSSLRTGPMEVLVRDREPIELLLPALRRARVTLLVNGAPPLRSSLWALGFLTTPVAAEQGVFDQVGRAAVAQAIARADGIVARRRLGLGAGEIVWEMGQEARERVVAVTCAPEPCPGVECGLRGCTATEPGWSCRCDPGDQPLRVVAPGGSRVISAVVRPQDAEAILRWPAGRSTVRGRWTGDLPCAWTIARDDLGDLGFLGGSTGGACDDDGALMAELEPGSWLLKVSSASGAQGAVAMDVDENDEELDVGEIAPASDVVTGDLRPRALLRDALVVVEPFGRLVEREDGAIVLQGVTQGGTVAVTVYNAERGTYGDAVLAEDGFLVELVPTWGAGEGAPGR